MPSTTESPPVRTVVRGEVPRAEREYAEDKVRHASRHAPGPVRSARIVLEHRPDPALDRPAKAEATIDVDGTPVRAQALAPSMREAVDLLAGRLDRRLVQVGERRRTRHRWVAVASEHEWRHGDLPRRELPHHPRPASSRKVVRRKSFATTPMTVDEAAYEMDLLDHDFFLYTDTETGTPALVHRLPQGGFAVSGGAGLRDQVATPGSALPKGAPPSLTESAARDRIEASAEPLVFYVDAETGDARVLYIRYDGHYGLIEGGPGEVGSPDSGG